MIRNVKFEQFFANLATKDENEFNGEQNSKNDSNILCHFDHFMSQKKMHEVLMLSETVSEICQREGVKSLADVGSGKAYLRCLELKRLGSIVDVKIAKKKFSKNLES